MILVNNPGSWDHVYSQLLHAEWIGFTLTDLIFPLFLFIAGVAMWFSFQKVERGDCPALLTKILQRTGLIFLIGLFISWFPFYDQTLDSLHFVGVLQRIAVSYLIASVVCISFGRIWVAATAALLLLGYWGLVVSSGADDPYAKDVVFSSGIDFVSFRSCLSSAVLIMIGFLVGSSVDRPRYSPTFFLGLIGIGVAMMLLGKLWALEFPIIKSLLWSSSYVVYSAGIAIALFTLCLWIIESAGVRSWISPFVLFGLNPLFLYSLSILLDKLTWMFKLGDEESTISLHEWIHQSLFQPVAGNINGSLLYAVSFVAIHWVVAYWLAKKRIYIKV